LYRFDKLRNGAIFAFFAFVFFLVSLDDHADRWRWKHGMAQLLFGGALYNLWQVVDPKIGKSAGLPFNL
jgi:hypothetical protein